MWPRHVHNRAECEGGCDSVTAVWRTRAFHGHAAAARHAGCMLCRPALGAAPRTG